ncbi:hypothetical protein [Pectobacterium parmentieri]|uniref:hypothetical protein n=1 Tax=Pectobacterium parmentieri TaxID=1905730 RepID=UPI0018DFA2BA|nr:hypothetical protein [Pectobacterium parmentieri]MBI0552713.1 hypothetical protein [Pectobacterium parmentieri]MBI0561735.1 hypothetical protein [Pectobacterium parmentieri]MBI0564114.1 hypothetical protein [Pectobacterium parmentieri]
MSTFGIVNVILTFSIIAVSFYFSNRIVKNSQRRDPTLIETGTDVVVTILSMKQSGLFLNNNPVVDMNLRLADSTGKTWLVEKHQETVLLISIDKYQVGKTYMAKKDENTDFIIFIKNRNGWPIEVEK